MNSKKHLIILILRILETDSDRENPITQTKIAEDISKQYPCDRKTVGRNIKFLINTGFPIVKTSKGFYMSNKTFTKDEVAFVLELVRHSELNEEAKIDLCDRLLKSLSRYYAT